MSEKIRLQPEKWVSEYADYLYGFALRRINNVELCKDLIQETFMSALKSKENFKGLSSERTWLTSILKFKIVDIYRNKAYKESLGVDRANISFEDMFDKDGHWKEANFPKPIGVSDPLETKELGRILQSCISRLPSFWRIIIIMKYVDDEDSDKICKDLNLTSSNYWVIIHRAKILLRACIEKNWINN